MSIENAFNDSVQKLDFLHQNHLTQIKSFQFQLSKKQGKDDALIIYIMVISFFHSESCHLVTATLRSSLVG
jgi:hypothetical protein